MFVANVVFKSSSQLSVIIEWKVILSFNSMTVKFKLDFKLEDDNTYWLSVN